MTRASRVLASGNGMYLATDGQLIACADENNELWAIAARTT
jgi:hypothetical protein